MEEPPVALPAVGFAVAAPLALAFPVALGVAFFLIGLPVAGPSSAAATCAFPARYTFLAAAPMPAMPPATAPTPFAAMPATLPTAWPNLFHFGPSFKRLSDSIKRS